MSAAAAPLAILRSAPVLGQPIAVGVVRAGAVVRHDDGAASARDDAFEQGYAAGLEKGQVAGFQQGHAEGLRLGQAEGLRAASERVKAEIDEATAKVDADAAAWRERLALAIAAVSEARRQVVAHAEHELATLAFELACKVLGPALASAEGVRAQVRLLLDGSQGPVTAHVHRALAAELAHMPSTDVRWVADDEVRMGGVRLHDGAATIDATLDTILGNFKSVVIRSLDEAAANRVEGAGA